MPEPSLLWSPHDPRIPFADTAFIRDLSLEDLIRLRTGRPGAVEPELSTYLSREPDTLRLRAALFAELLETPGLFEALRDSFAHLAAIYELQDTRDGALSEEQLLYSIREMEDYLDYLASLKRIFSEYTVKSELLLGLWRAVEPLATGEDYAALCAAVERQSHAIKNIKSVTVGVNLDPALRPVEAGLVAVNEQSFVSGDAISHLLRMNFKKDDFTCMAPLCPTARKFTPQEMAAMGESVNTALRKVFGDSLRSWAATIKSHVPGNLRILAPVAEEWRFITAAMDTLLGLQRAGFPLCTPVLSDGPSVSASEHMDGLYHPLLALTAEHPTRVVRNPLRFDGEGRLYILTGPNSGGKSVYLQAVGSAYAMLHLGLPLPAAAATVRPADEILTHVSDPHDTTRGHGRLGTACARVQAINRLVTSDSLLLFDEAFSGTNASEATAISAECLAAYAELGARGIWVTHLHDLCRLPETLPASAPSRLQNLTARLDESTHDRLFTITRETGSPHSYAMDIARAFHLTREEILAAAHHS